MQTLKQLNGTVDTILEPYKIIDDHIVSVCACCFPGDSITILFPDLKEMNLSHGYCPRHARREMDSFALKCMADELRGHNTAYFRMGPLNN